MHEEERKTEGEEEEKEKRGRKELFSAWEGRS